MNQVSKGDMSDLNGALVRQMWQLGRHAAGSRPTAPQTAAGKQARDDVEALTDRLATAPWQGLGEAAGRLAQLTMPVTMAVVGSGMLPKQSTLGLGSRQE